MVIVQDKYFKIITITEQNLNQVLNIYQQCEDFLSLGPEAKASEKMVREDFEHSKKEKGLFCGIFDLTENMIGIVDFIPYSFEGNKNNAFISLIMIAKPYRNEKYGTNVIKAIEKHIFKNPQVSTILSAVQVNNNRAIKFWSSAGYHIVGEPEVRPDKTIVYNLRKEL